MKIRISNDILNPAIWNSNATIKPEVRETLLKIAMDFYAETELEAPIQDIIMLGSNANYNWSKTSDIDVHIVIKFTDINDDIELVKKMVDSLKSNWNKVHDIKIKNYDVELYLQDVSKFNRSTGLYSILKNNWIRLPKKEQFSLDKNFIKTQYNLIVKEINKAIKNKDSEKLKTILKNIYALREAGLNKSGELSNENIIFKILRLKNYLSKLKDAIIDLYDKKVSIKQENIKNNK